MFMGDDEPWNVKFDIGSGTILDNFNPWEKCGRPLSNGASRTGFLPVMGTS
jgi:hypothetical protein